MNFHVGQKVVCIKNATGSLGPRRFPPFQRGEVLTIARMKDWGDGLGLFLAFEEHDPLHFGHHLGFRPVKTTDISVFTALLAPEPNAPVKKRERQDA